MSVESLLVAERPQPPPEFTAELDARAAEGFARRGKRQPRPRRRFGLQYALGAAGVVAITAVAVSASGVLRDDEGSDRGAIPEVQSQLEEVPDAPARSQAERPTVDPNADVTAEELAAPPPRRQVARTADLALSTAPADLPDVADGVVDVTHRYRGFVLDSTVSSDRGPSSHADFDLRFPARDLQAALDDLSDLAHVGSLTEGTDDITRRFTTGRERIEELTAKRDRLRAKLEAAGSPEQRAVLRAELGGVRDSLAAVRDDLAQATERVRFVPVHVAIEANADEADTGWSIGDALDDALRVLEVAVGVALIALAAGAPIALVAVLLWLAARAWVRRRREQALDERPAS